MAAGRQNYPHVGTGCTLWAKRIRERNKSDIKPSLGLKLVESLNLATIMGLPLATCVYFLANRLLSISVAERADKEVLGFFLTWLAVTVLAFIRQDKLQWRVMAVINSVACLSVPLINAITTNGNIINYFLHKQWTLFMFDALFLVFSFLFYVQSKKLCTATTREKAINASSSNKLTGQQG